MLMLSLLKLALTIAAVSLREVVTGIQ